MWEASVLHLMFSLRSVSCFVLLLKCVRKVSVLLFFFLGIHIWLYGLMARSSIFELEKNNWRFNTEMKNHNMQCRCKRHHGWNEASDFQVSIAWVIIGNWNLILLRLSHSFACCKSRRDFKAVKSNFKTLECFALTVSTTEKQICSRSTEEKAISV